MTRELFIAILTEYGVKKAHAEHMWDTHPEMVEIEPASIRKVGCAVQAVMRKLRGEPVDTDGVIDL